MTLLDEDDYDSVSPAASLLRSLRSIGNTLSNAVANIVDNSIAAHAKPIGLEFERDGDQSCVAIVDDGDGVSESELREAMRLGACNPLEVRHASDLGRFGLGLKTASFSQCRQPCVISKKKGVLRAVRTWDLDHVVSQKRDGR